MRLRRLLRSRRGAVDLLPPAPVAAGRAPPGRGGGRERMSGGSWDYLCDKMDEAADRLRESGNPHRRAFGALMARCARAMHEIEWYDRCDTSGEAVQPAIEAALGANAGALVLDETRQRV